MYSLKNERGLQRLASLFTLIFAVRWPSVWEFSLLCCFPAGLFCWAAVSSGAIHNPPMTRVVTTVVVIHCLLLAGTLYLWNEYPRSRTADFAFGFVVIEVAVIALLVRYARPRQDGADSIR